MTRMIALLVLLASPTLLLAQTPRWVQTDIWRTTGTAQTRMFTLNGAKYIVRCIPRGKGPFRVALCNQQGEEISVFTNQKKRRTFSVRAKRRDRGIYYLSVSADEALDWTISIEQYLAVIEEWDLVQERKQVKRPVTVAAWTGEGGKAATSTLHITEGSWRLSRQFAGAGTLLVIVRDEEGREIVRNRSNSETEQICWIHRSGQFTFEIVGSADVQWKVTAAKEQP
ncbi:MAG: hypothetical protein KAI66_06900 [Lentisphaeria bacterium]|nr:hypothetical protein [Lentisphaeria bacterium]